MNPWEALLSGLETLLNGLHDTVEPFFGTHSWGWAIIALTLLVRLVLLPLAVKQTRSMRGMQAIQPKVKALQEKYKVDRDLLRKDPETYQRKKAELNEKLMALYKEEGVNPASSCLPLLLQMPIFFALFRILNGDRIAALSDAQFYFFTDPDVTSLATPVSDAGWPGWLLIALMVVTMFITQRQMMARNTAEGPAATQQKIMLYVFPVFLSFISFSLPMALLLYWVTTNVWQGVQQWLIFRAVHHEEAEAIANGRSGSSSPKGSSNSSSTKNTKSDTKSDTKSAPKKDDSWPQGGKGAAASKNGSNSHQKGKKGGSGKGRSSGHLPKRNS